MTTQAHTGTIGARGTGRGIALGAGAALLVVAAAFALISWPIGETTKPDATREQAVPPAVSRTAPAPTAAAEAITVYLVGSDAEGAALLRGIKLAVAKFEGGELPTNEMVLAVGTAAEQARAQALIKDLRLQLGDGNVRLVDARTPAASDASGCGLDVRQTAC